MSNLSQNPDGISKTNTTLATPTAGTTNQVCPLPSWLALRPWLTFVLPFAVFMLVGSLEPTPDKPFNLLDVTIEYSAYPIVYSVKIVLTMLAMAAVRPGYRQFAFRVSPLALAVGAVGVVLWVGICKLELEAKILGPLGLGWLIETGSRSAFNPFSVWPDQPLFAYGFLAVRLWGLAIVVPVIEEFFLRGLVMRYVIDPDWWKVPFGTLSTTAVIVGTLVPVAMHPAEIFAATVWFTLITWLMFKTKNIWDCVAAHAVTNLLLGVWVVVSGDWHFL